MCCGVFQSRKGYQFESNWCCTRGWWLSLVDAYSVGNVLAVELWQLSEGHGRHSVQQLLMNHLQLAETPNGVAQCLHTTQNISFGISTKPAWDYVHWAKPPTTQNISCLNLLSSFELCWHANTGNMLVQQLAASGVLKFVAP